MRETHTKTVDGVQFRIQQLGFRSGRKALVRLSKRIGPTLARLMDAAPSMDALRDSVAPGGDLVGAVESFVDALDDDDLEWFADTFGASCEVSEDGERWRTMNKQVREDLFAGRLLLFFAWLRACVEVNFSDFFSLLRGSESDPRPVAGESPGNS